MGENGSPMKQARNLYNPVKVRSFMTSVINAQLRKLITPHQHSAINGSCKIILDCLREGEFSDRVAKLEKALQKKLKKMEKRGY